MKTKLGIFWLQSTRLKLWTQITRSCNLPLSLSSAYIIFGCAGWELPNVEFPFLAVRSRKHSTCTTPQDKLSLFCTCCKMWCDSKLWSLAQGRGTQRPPSPTSLSLLLLVLNAGEAPLCSPLWHTCSQCMGLLGEEDTNHIFLPSLQCDCRRSAHSQCAVHI